MLRFGVGRSVCLGFLLLGIAVEADAQSSGSGQSQVDPSKPRAPFQQAIHFTSGNRNKGTIKRVVLHTIEGPASSAVSWFKNPSSKVSAHYVVDFSGGVTQMVLEKDQAWHVRNNNADTIGIEHAGYARRNQWTQAQVATSARLTGMICSDYEIEPSRSTIVSHAALDPARRSDPGAYFPWGQYLQLVQQAKQQADQAKKNGTPMPPLSGGGLSQSQGSANPSGQTFADSSVNTGTTGGGGATPNQTGALAGANGTGANGTAQSDPLAQAAGELIGGLLEGALKKDDPNANPQATPSPATPPAPATATPSGVTARGSASVNGGYNTLAASSSSQPTTSSTPTATPEAPSPSTRRTQATADEASSPETPESQTESADPDAGGGSSYGGASRGPGAGGGGAGSRSRGQGAPGDARRERQRDEAREPARAEEQRRVLDRDVARAMQTLKALGYKNVAGAGILASLIEESNLETGVLAGTLDDVRAAGVGYWADEGLDSLWADAERRGASWEDLGFQLEHLDAELARDFPSMRRRLRSASSPEVAARIVASGLFQLDRNEHRAELDRRASLAREIFEGRFGAEQRASARAARGERSSGRATERAEPREQEQRWDDF